MTYIYKMIQSKSFIVFDIKTTFYYKISLETLQYLWNLDIT